jgi:formylglycine-generating enzyme required for sulfatase activity
MAGGLEFMKNMKSRMFIPFLSLCFLILEPITLLGNFPADFVPDCNVNFNDFAVLASAWLTENGAPNYNSKCDISEPNDGVINEKDLAVFADFWFTKYPGDMVYIPGGTFQMGDSIGDGENDELPVHTVTLSSFYISKYEVTNGQYCQYLNSALNQGLIKVLDNIVFKAGLGTTYLYCLTSTRFPDSQINFSGIAFTVRTKGGRDMSNDPMVLVTWYGAVAYCNWRNQQEGKEICYDFNDPNWPCDFDKQGYRLPTEAEWEYAARGGLSGKRFPWGDTITHSQSNYYSDSSYSYDISPTRGYHPTWNDGTYPYTSPVVSLEANGYGIYDMAGNVWELCNDWYGSPYDSSPQTNPTGPTTGNHGRVLRGGGWCNYANLCRVANRAHIAPNNHNYGNGFRVVLDLN